MIVYYAATPTIDGDLIKIGSTRALANRLLSLARDPYMAGPPKLLAVEYGGYQVEQQRLRQFACHCVRREWFRPAADLTHHITALGPLSDALGDERIAPFVAPTQPRPQSGERLSQFNIRLDEDARRALEAEALRLEVGLSDVMRAALTHWSRLPKRERKI